MEDKSCSPVPSLSESNISYGMHGRTRQLAETISATMAPNVGLPYSTTEEGKSDRPSRLDTGYVSHALCYPKCYVTRPTPDDFRSNASGRLRPDSYVDPDIYFAGNDRIRTPKSVTFRRVRGRERQTIRSSSSSSADSSEGESDTRFMTRSRRHGSGGARDPPVKVAGLGDPPFQTGGARPRWTRPL